MQAKVQALKFYKRYLEKKFPDLSTEASTSKIIKLSTKNLSPTEVDLLVATTPKRWADNDNIISLGSNNRYKSNGWTFGN